MGLFGSPTTTTAQQPDQDVLLNGSYWVKKSDPTGGSIAYSPGMDLSQYNYLGESGATQANYNRNKAYAQSLGVQAQPQYTAKPMTLRDLYDLYPGLNDAYHLPNGNGAWSIKGGDGIFYRVADSAGGNGIPMDEPLTPYASARDHLTDADWNAQIFYSGLDLTKEQANQRLNAIKESMAADADFFNPANLMGVLSTVGGPLLTAATAGVVNPFTTQLSSALAPTVGQTAADIGANALTQAGIQSGLGAGNAALMGKDPLQGAASGAVTGAIGGGFAAGTKPLINTLSPYVGNEISTIGANAITGAAGGTGIKALVNAINGKDVTSGLGLAAGSGGFGGATKGLGTVIDQQVGPPSSPYLPSTGRVIAGGVNALGQVGMFGKDPTQEAIKYGTSLIDPAIKTSTGLSANSIVNPAYSMLQTTPTPTRVNMGGADRTQQPVPTPTSDLIGRNALDENGIIALIQYKNIFDNTVRS